MVLQRVKADVLKRMTTENCETLRLRFTKAVRRRVGDIETQAVAQRSRERFTVERTMPDLLEQQNVNLSFLGPDCQRVRDPRIPRDVHTGDSDGVLC